MVGQQEGHPACRKPTETIHKRSFGTGRTWSYSTKVDQLKQLETSGGGGGVAAALVAAPAIVAIIAVFYICVMTSTDDCTMWNIKLHPLFIFKY